jgi:RNA polymerase sigma-70 factor (ECF subfamily)
MTDFAALYEHHARDVYRFALYLCGNPAEAEDITSETFVRAWNSSGEIWEGTAKAYLLTIARNYYRKELRRSSRNTLLEDGLQDHGPGPHALAQHKQELMRVMNGLKDLSEVDRSVLHLRVNEEWPYQQIADALGLTVVSVKVKLHRARLKLMKIRSLETSET